MKIVLTKLARDKEEVKEVEDKIGTEINGEKRRNQTQFQQSNNN